MCTSKSQPTLELAWLETLVSLQQANESGALKLTTRHRPFYWKALYVRQAPVFAGIPGAEYGVVEVKSDHEG